jgi:hypothetical protein
MDSFSMTFSKIFHSVSCRSCRIPQSLLNLMATLHNFSPSRIAISILVSVPVSAYHNLTGAAGYTRVSLEATWFVTNTDMVAETELYKTE